MDLIFKNFSTGYENNQVICDLNLKINSGEWVGIIGSNGSGKSTLLKGIAKIIPMQSGDLYLNKFSIKDLSTKKIAKVLSYLPQKINSNLPLTVKELVSLGRSPHKYFWEFDLNKEDLLIINKSLELCNLKNYSNNSLSSLSGGQCQRAFLALTIAQNTKILLLDEPTTFLDINFQIQMLDLIKNLNKIKKLTILSVIHDINLAARYCDRLAIFKDGELLAIDKPNEALSEDLIKEAFSIEIKKIETPVGKQICAIRASKD
tara:strand:+ start:359 stop:1141 length:783 start_codon:yes stop_codon:yes gene_type:complete